MRLVRIPLFVGALAAATAGLGAQAAPGGKLAPHGIGAEDTYTITTLVKVLRPCNPAVMTDPYQDVKVLSDNGKCLTLSITYFPLNDKTRAFRTVAYTTKSGDLSRYIRPTVTCNWDAGMRAELLRELRRDGIDPKKLKAEDLVSQVATWAFRKSTFASNTDAMPSDWFVAFEGGRPKVYPPTRDAFQQSKTDPKWTDQQVFDHQLYGRQMFVAKTHGACTSSAIYLATILRALGVPTRILYFIPACDANDPKQIKMLSAAITRGATRQKVMDGINIATGFANHMFNEVCIDGLWRRLNYDKLGQDIVDDNYLGLMTHIDTCVDISETHLAETWGVRSSKWPDVTDKLSSINPYQVIAAADHWGRHAVRDNSVAQELTQATVTGVLWPGTPEYRELVSDDPSMPKTDLVLTIKEWIENRNYVQLREFIALADPHFVLRSPGHPDIGFHYNSLKVSNANERGFAMRYDNPNGLKPIPGVAYTLVPRNQTGSHPWKIPAGLKVTAPGGP